ncbi:hypothetical protein [Flavobacterium aestuarii]|uniref:hypothetical protein n=1 Tax=Flavobacterium aestuarii TaxID=3149227 RepID=UPI0032B32FEF
MKSIYLKILPILFFAILLNSACTCEEEEPAKETNQQQTINRPQQIETLKD